MSVEIALQSTLVSGDHSGALPNVASCAIHVKANFGRQCPSNHSPHSCCTDHAGIRDDFAREPMPRHGLSVTHSACHLPTYSQCDNAFTAPRTWLLGPRKGNQACI